MCNTMETYLFAEFTYENKGKSKGGHEIQNTFCESCIHSVIRRKIKLCVCFKNVTISVYFWPFNKEINTFLQQSS